jgi:hypothetical protein
MALHRTQPLKISERREQVADLYVKGWRQMAIAEKLDISQATVCLDLKAIQKFWRESAVRNFDAARDLELQKLDRIEYEAWGAWTESKKPAQSATMTEGTRQQQTRKTLKNQHGNPRYLELIARCIAQRCMILGLNMLPANSDENAHVSLAFDARRDRVIGVFATLRERGRAEGPGAGPPVIDAGDVRLDGERGALEDGPAPGAPGPDDPRVD